MVDILKKLYVNDIDMSIEKSWSGSDVIFRLKKSTAYNTYAQNIFIDLKTLDKIDNPDSYIAGYVRDQIDDFLRNIEKIEAVRPSEIEISK